MKTFSCQCGNTVFFENTKCVSCQHELGWCPACKNVTTLVPAEGGQFRCGTLAWQVLLAKCHNYKVEHDLDMVSVL